MFKLKITFAAALMMGCATGAFAQDAGQGTSLREAVEVAMASNPEILQAQFNKEAIEFERRQAQGLYAPRVDLEASAGVRRLENATRRNLGIANNELYPLEASAKADWTIVDFGRRRGELLRQTSRVDGASLRVLERSEFVALQIARQYLDIMLQQRIVAASLDNVGFHQTLVSDLGEGVEQGSISIADRQQAEERLQSAVVRQEEAYQDLENAKITLRRLTGLDISQGQLPPSFDAMLPANLDQAVGFARVSNPRILEAKADVDAANALAQSALGDLYPTIGAEVVGRIGDDIDGFQGETNDVQARLYLRWNIFDGGINRAKYQEMVRRSSQARYRLHQVNREAEEDVRAAWTAIKAQDNITAALDRQSRVSDDLLLSYRSQFNVGRRSLLDVLDAQNTRYNTQVRLETARFSQLFAEYQTLAATNRFLEALELAPGAGAGETERQQFNYGPETPAELQRRVYP
ncbi:agglutination protein [Altererythrobacter confluentis]|uniref:Agglutination protein n=1 Tax=Allopontixanthobacter confluentis TaxID=1849021 RepID=A0A6L7GH11_9SPHN|nr:TolC family protein [Allopontixanthobacter confluentis]MXP14756.1 agglutination protein [Allopontixanthobacter confluentis]